MLFLEALKLASLRQISVSAQDSRVIVEGELESFYERQLVIACIKRVAEVRQVDDKITIRTDTANFLGPSRNGGSETLRR
jgi:hypothetical protein